MTRSPTDEELVERTLAGEEDAFSQLYDRYRRPVYATSYRIIQNSEEALDTTQEIFIKLHRSMETWNPKKSKFSTWVYRLATNHAIDRWRLRRRRGESPLEEESAESTILEESLRDAIRSPYDEVERNEAVEQVRRCCETLPALQKKVFILRYFQDMKLEEISEIEDCSLGTVKTSLFRATQTLRRRLRRSRELQ